MSAEMSMFETSSSSNGSLVILASLTAATPLCVTCGTVLVVLVSLRTCGEAGRERATRVGTGKCGSIRALLWVQRCVSVGTECSAHIGFCLTSSVATGIDV